MQTPSEQATWTLYTNWLKTAREKQLQPKIDHFIWLILAGRGWGKTRTGAQDIALYALKNPDSICAVVAPTFGDLRRVCFGGDSGLLSIIPEDCMDKNFGSNGYAMTTQEIRLNNGSKIIGFAAIKPDRLRGPQYHRVWADELCAWQDPQEVFDQIMFGLRLGDKPQCVITTTPKPIKLIKELIGREDVQITKGNTFENKDNLAESALAMMLERYDGTTIGRQELYAEVLDDVEGALWNAQMIESTRLPAESDIELQQIVVAIDPAVTSGESADETGIIVCGRDFEGHFYILEDLSGRHTPDKWCRIAVRAFYEWEADKVVAEVNQGGDLVERVLRTIDDTVPYRAVRATRSKFTRAEPISALYEQKRVHHIGYYEELESQMCTYTGLTKEASPDRLDALVWGLFELSKSRGNVNWRIT